MTTTQIVIIALIVVAVAAALAATSRSGPRVTQITRSVERDKKDGDDA